jgi:predicted nucleic acid-binding Zn ribbon protein
MAEKLVQHRHCQMCLKATPLGEEYCSEECKDNWNKLIKQNKRKNVIVWIWMMVAVIVLIFIMMVSQ